MWVRGLKHAAEKASSLAAGSHPMWVRGLKHEHAVEEACRCLVAPYVGAWIETLSSLNVHQTGDVAPYVGAWIETMG